jgi:hypothetical protein
MKIFHIYCLGNAQSKCNLWLIEQLMQNVPENRPDTWGTKPGFYLH